MGHSKTNQNGKDNPKLHPDKPILGDATDALKRWLKAAELKKGPLFQRLWKHKVGPGLSAAAIGEIVKRRAQLAGLPGDWAGHSLRSGFVTEAGKQGVSLGSVMALTDHTSIESVVGYYQSGSATNNPAANLLAKKTS